MRMPFSVPLKWHYVHCHILIPHAKPDRITFSKSSQCWRLDKLCSFGTAWEKNKMSASSCQFFLGFALVLLRVICVVEGKLQQIRVTNFRSDSPSRTKWFSPTALRRWCCLLYDNEATTIRFTYFLLFWRTLPGSSVFASLILPGFGGVLPNA